MMHWFDSVTLTGPRMLNKTLPLLTFDLNY